MTLNKERKLWRVVGVITLLLGIAIMIGAVAMLADFDDPLNKSPSRMQAIGDGVAWSGVAALVLARVLGLLGGAETEPSVIWTVVSYGSLLVGGAGGMLEAVAWRYAVNSGLQEGGLTSWQKAGVLGAGFFLLTGVIALIGDRTARHFVNSKSRSARA
jgi:hypothetical protein